MKKKVLDLQYDGEIGESDSVSKKKHHDKC